MQERLLVEKIRAAGGRIFLVGGYVRDLLRGVKSKDKDYVVTGIGDDAFRAIFPEVRRVGQSFPVYLLPLDGQNCEVALARKERKVSEGYKGFAVEHGSEVTIAEDLYRRDTTINSMAIELPFGTLFDPHGGQEDLKRKIIRAVSHHFLEDPVRALRAARQAAEFKFSIDKATVGYMQACRKELLAEPVERLLGELTRALGTEQPSRFFAALEKAGLLAAAFPEIAALIGKKQPREYHPEGDAYVHTLQVLDATAAATTEIKARFAALAHDLGKGLTPKESEPHHYRHEVYGLDVLTNWNRRMTLPKVWLKAARFVIAEHMRAPRLQKPVKMVKLLFALDSAGLSLDEFRAIIRADSHGLPPYLAYGEQLLSNMRKISGHCAPSHLQGAQIAAWLTAERTRILCRLLKEF